MANNTTRPKLIHTRIRSFKISLYIFNEKKVFLHDDDDQSLFLVAFT